MPLVRTAQKLLIELKLPDQTSTVFPRARLFLSNGNELAVSPVGLTHLTDGLYRYTGPDIGMPNDPFLTAIISVFDDAIFSEQSEDFADGIDVFELIDDLTIQLPFKKGSQLVQFKSKEKIGVTVKLKSKIKVGISPKDKIQVEVTQKQKIKVSSKSKPKINITIKKGD